MREIKFRAWTGARMIGAGRCGHFVEFDGEVWANMTDLTNNGYDNLVPQGKIELMQYTGLKDKNGVEIYENDIVRSDKSTVNVVKWSGRECGWVARWERRRAWSNHIDSGEPKLGYREHEVIGNIYQNPELLEAEK